MLSLQNIDTEIAATRAKLDLLQKIKELRHCTMIECNNRGQLSLGYGGCPQMDELSSNAGQRIIDDDAQSESTVSAKKGNPTTQSD